MVGLLLDRGSQIDAKTRVSTMKNTTQVIFSHILVVKILIKMEFISKRHTQHTSPPLSSLLFKGHYWWNTIMSNVSAVPFTKGNKWPAHYYISISENRCERAMFCCFQSSWTSVVSGLNSVSHSLDILTSVCVYFDAILALFDSNHTKHIRPWLVTGSI